MAFRQRGAAFPRLLHEPPPSRTGLRTSAVSPPLRDAVPAVVCVHELFDEEDDPLGHVAATRARRRQWPGSQILPRVQLSGLRPRSEGLGLFLGVLGEELIQGDAQDASDVSQVEDGDIALAALDGADEGAVQAALLGQPRLRPAALLLPGPQAGAQLARNRSN